MNFNQQVINNRKTSKIGWFYLKYYFKVNTISKMEVYFVVSVTTVFSKCVIEIVK